MSNFVDKPDVYDSIKKNLKVNKNYDSNEVQALCRLFRIIDSGIENQNRVVYNLNRSSFMEIKI